MTNLKRAIFPILLFVAAAGVLWGRFAPVEVPRPVRWADAPIVCPDPEVPLSTLAEAVGFWNVHGEHLIIDCVDYNVTVTLDPTIDLRASVDDEELVHGITHVFTTFDTESTFVYWADIRLRPGVGALAMAHELGHALGYEHARGKFFPPNPPSGVLMHPSRPGWNDRGL